LCLRRGWPFTTAFHTRFPEYVHARACVPLGLSYAALRWFHGRAERVLVATRSIEADLHRWGIRNTAPWSRGVDTALFRPRAREEVPAALRALPRPIHLCVGRVAVEKNLEAFLALELPGSRVVVGDGPALADLQRRHPGACFVGAKHGEELARHYAAGDVFVFPSRTDTFGLVMLEALASGVPVAAFPVPGPVDVVGGTDVAVLDEDLAAAARAALAIPRERCRAFAERHSWRACAELMASHLAPFLNSPRAALSFAR
jgi:glycosyltransferase involved in cell wall biosynthesis